MIAPEAIDFDIVAEVGAIRHRPQALFVALQPDNSVGRAHATRGRRDRPSDRIATRHNRMPDRENRGMTISSPITLFNSEFIPV